MTIAKRFLFWAIVAVAALGLLEMVTAGYFLLQLSRTYYRPLYLQKRNDQLLWRTEHDDWGAWHRPSSTAYHTHHCFSVGYRSNSYGARDKERSVIATAKRGVLLGDSFMEGYGVDEQKRLSNLLERHLGLEFLNFGGTQLGPLQYQILYEKLARRFHHELVIIGFLPYNDFTDNDLAFNRRHRDFLRRYRPYYAEDGGIFYPRPRPAPDEPSIFAVRATGLHEGRPLSQNLQRLFWLYGLYGEIRYNVGVVRDATPSDYLGYFERDTLRISRATESILAIRDFAAPKPVLVLFIPDSRSWSHIERHPESYDQSVVTKLQILLERQGIRTIDLLKQFMSRRLDRRSLYLPCDGHWNDAGHQAAFDVVHPVVRELLQNPP